MSDRDQLRASCNYASIDAWSSDDVSDIVSGLARVAQLDRASDFGSEGQGFKSSRARHTDSMKAGVSGLLCLLGKAQIR